jgi:DNA-binding NarL/FixJ family response regulator
MWRPDVVVMDLNLPGMSGIEATRRIMQFDTDAKVLIFSIHDETIYITRSFDAGASGYLSKSCAPQEMVDAVREVASGQIFIGSGLSGNAATLSKDEGDPLRLLSPREFEVFQLLGKGSGTREVAEALSLSSKTVSNYSTLIKEKLGLGSSTELVKVAMEFLATQKPRL